MRWSNGRLAFRLVKASYAHLTGREAIPGPYNQPFTRTEVAAFLADWLARYPGLSLPEMVRMSGIPAKHLRPVIETAIALKLIRAEVTDTIRYYRQL